MKSFTLPPTSDTIRDPRSCLRHQDTDTTSIASSLWCEADIVVAATAAQLYYGRAAEEAGQAFYRPV
eukprot:scaffold436_cov55-Cyclotella_meneghiniana.AAC.5